MKSKADQHAPYDRDPKNYTSWVLAWRDSPKTMWSGPVHSTLIGDGCYSIELSKPSGSAALSV